MTLRLVDPTLRPAEGTLPRAPRPRSLESLRIGLVANGKTHSVTLLERIAHNLAQSHSLAGTRSILKARVNEPPEPEDIDSMAQECGAVLAAIGD